MTLDNNLLITSIASMSSGTIGRLICFPMDTIKAKLYIQRDQTTPGIKSIIKIIKQTMLDEGLKGFYKGLPISLIGSAPAYALYITSYEWFKSNLPLKKTSFLSFMAAGFCAEALSCILWLPIDVVKERLQVRLILNQEVQRSINAMRQIVKNEGLLGLYRGYGATLGSFGTFSAVYFLLYENLKLKICQDPTKPLFKESIVNSLGAYLVASFVSNPLDIAKLRLQVQRIQGVHPDSNVANFDYKNQLHGIIKIYKDEGLLAFYRGYSARLIYGSSLTTISMSLMEYFRNQLKNKQSQS